MKRFWGNLLLGFVVVFHLSAAATNHPPISAWQLRGMIEGCQKAVTNGQEQVFDASFETVTNKLLDLKPNPDAKVDVIPGRELKSGLFYLCIPEQPVGDITGKDTAILVTRINLKSTRVQMKTTKLGLFFNSRDRQLEKQRMAELSELLSTNN